MPRAMRQEPHHEPHAAPPGLTTPASRLLTPSARAVAFTCCAVVRLRLSASQLPPPACHHCHHKQSATTCHRVQSSEFIRGKTHEANRLGQPYKPLPESSAIAARVHLLISPWVFRTLPSVTENQFNDVSPLVWWLPVCRSHRETRCRRRYRRTGPRQTPRQWPSSSTPSRRCLSRRRWRATTSCKCAESCSPGGTR